MSKKEILPLDLDYMVSLTDQIAKTEIILSKYKIALDLLKANITRHVTQSDKYWVNGRPPSMSYIQTVYLIVGYDEETAESLLDLMNNIAEAESTLGDLKAKFTVEKGKLEVWRTHSANRRSAVGFIGTG